MAYNMRTHMGAYNFLPQQYLSVICIHVLTAGSDACPELYTESICLHCKAFSPTLTHLDTGADPLWQGRHVCVTTRGARSLLIIRHSKKYISECLPDSTAL